MADVAVAAPEARRRSARRAPGRWRVVLVAAVGLVVVYYAVVIAGTQLGGDATAVALDDRALAPGFDRVTVEVEAVALDPSAGVFDLRLRPTPHGRLVGDAPGELAVPLELRVASPGTPPASFDFPSGQLIDPVAATVEATGGARAFPFDRPRITFRLEALSAGERVPVAVEMADHTEGWNLGGSVRSVDDALRFELGARRELLPVSFTLFYVVGIVVVALITVALIGGALVRRQVGFDQVIWLVAMLVAMPAVRNEMPGVPPIGTAVDLFVFLPSVVIVAAALLASIVVLTLQEAAQARAAREGGSAPGDVGPGAAGHLFGGGLGGEDG